MTPVSLGAPKSLARLYAQALIWAFEQICMVRYEQALKVIIY